MRFRKKKEDESTISIAPLIDIVFLLLIFFMVTSHYDIASGVRINLPKVSRGMSDSLDESRVNLLIDENGKVYLDSDVIDLEALRKNLEEKVKEKGLLHLILQADRDVSHGKVVEIMDLAKGAGVHSIIIAAKINSGELL